MNKKKRERLKRAVSLLGEAATIVSAVADEEQDCFDNLPEGLQESDRGVLLEDAADRLNDIADDIERVSDEIEEVINM